MEQHMHTEHAGTQGHSRERGAVGDSADAAATLENARHELERSANLAIRQLLDMRRYDAHQDSLRINNVEASLYAVIGRLREWKLARDRAAIAKSLEEQGLAWILESPGSSS